MHRWSLFKEWKKALSNHFFFLFGFFSSSLTWVKKRQISEILSSFERNLIKCKKGCLDENRKSLYNAFFIYCLKSDSSAGLIRPKRSIFRFQYFRESIRWYDKKAKDSYRVHLKSHSFLLNEKPMRIDYAYLFSLSKKAMLKGLCDFRWTRYLCWIADEKLRFGFCL